MGAGHSATVTSRASTRADRRKVDSPSVSPPLGGVRFAKGAHRSRRAAAKAVDQVAARRGHRPEEGDAVVAGVRVEQDGAKPAPSQARESCPIRQQRSEGAGLPWPFTLTGSSGWRLSRFRTVCVDADTRSAKRVSMPRPDAPPTPAVEHSPSPTCAESLAWHP